MTQTHLHLKANWEVNMANVAKCKSSNKLDFKDKMLENAKIILNIP